ncbi:hypothetical protein TWF102_007524 [Orbilia oligospora]|uniref:GATA-type domain-containing protein n=3 Tax=Orbilia oligospora TaxID=2813651 RepID=A0A7C8J4N9_ORBOL|nr:hypothetical protein TWF103_001679 [Orbilia oligospora]KAF3094399.1 hypothetical protein TWF102_007524 [Orbilia oligospora]KAF3126141.1 hypothetical protein TWF594_001212 [Orbilia oligospora]
MGSTSENERRKSDTLPSLSYPRFDRTSDDSYSPHRQNPGSSAVITPTSPTPKYASPLSASSTLPKHQGSDYIISPPESRRTSEREDESSRHVNSSRPITLPSLPSLNQMMDALPANYQPSSIVSTGGVPSGPPSLSSALPSSSISRSFPPRPLYDSESSGPLPPSSALRPPSSHHSSPTTNLPPPINGPLDKPGPHSRNVTPQQNHGPGLPFPNREASETYPPYGSSDHGMKGSPRSQPGPNENQFGRPPPPPPPPPPQTHYTHGYEQNHSSYEHQQYVQISPHISGFPPPPPPPPPAHPPPNSNYQSGGVSASGNQPFPGQAAALYAYQSRGGPYGNETSSHSEGPFSPKGKSISGKTSFQDTYGSAINRALDISELRRNLDMIRDNASHLYHFSTQYTPQGGQPGGFQALKYSGQIEPSIQALDDAISITHRILDALQYWRTKVVSDQSRKHEQQINTVKPMPKRSIDHIDDDMSYAGDDMRGALHPDPKKQRKGKAAPPGRCHSCNRAETPEWRRGPDGARTLCNACGLHYAKLTRKLSKNNNASASINPSPLARKSASASLM